MSSPIKTPGGTETANTALKSQIFKEMEKITVEEAVTNSTASPTSTRSLVLLFSSIILMTFTTALQTQIMNSTLPYVYSAFQAHSLIPTTNIVSSVLAAVIRLSLAKFIDLWGRAQGFAVTLTLYTVGVAMMAACNNVVTYAAASVFLFTGFDGMFYILSVVIADCFSLRNRGLLFGLYSAPYLVITWIGAPAASRFLQGGAGWRWSFGVFAIVAPIAGIPLFIMLRKFEVARVAPSRPKHQNPLESLKYYWIEFDVIGLVLLSAGFSLLLLPFSLAAGQAKGWSSPMIICMIVFGVAGIVLFGLWETYLAPKSFLPLHLMKNWTVITGSISSANTFLVYSIWYAYFSSSLQVVQGLTITTSGYVFNIHNVGWTIAGVLAGLLIRTSSRYKWIALYVAWPLQILSTGLMLYFSKPDSPIGLIIMAQIFLAVADGLIFLTSEVAVLAVIEPEHIAIVLALYNMVTSIFRAIGSTISSAIWTKEFPAALFRNVPADGQMQVLNIYHSLPAQLSFPVGSPMRVAINQSYATAMSKLFTAAVPLTVIGLIATFMWKDIRIEKSKPRPSSGA